jgi:hypothetical protein
MAFGPHGQVAANLALETRNQQPAQRVIDHFLEELAVRMFLQIFQPADEWRRPAMAALGAVRLGVAWGGRFGCLMCGGGCAFRRRWSGRFLGRFGQRQSFAGHAAAALGIPIQFDR